MGDLWKFLHRRSFQTALRGVRTYMVGPQGRRRVQALRLFYRMRITMIVRSPVSYRLSRRREIKLWEDNEVFPRIEKLLKRARHTVLIQMFIWKDDELGRRMAEVLLLIAERGVKVDIAKEAVGDAFEFNEDFLATKQETSGTWFRFWHHPNIAVTHGAEHDHGKVFIIDGAILLLTGMNIANEYHESWHDYMVELRGGIYVEQYLSGGEVVPSGPIRLVLNMQHRKEIRPVLRDLLRSARESIVVEHAYLADADVIDILAQKSHEGIRVTMILSKEVDFHYHANMQSVGLLLREASPAFLRIMMYPRMIHGKIILVDRETAYVGSANLVTSSLDQMGEVNVIIHGKHRAAVRKIRDILRRDILRSRPFKNPPWRYGPGWWLSLLRL